METEGTRQRQTWWYCAKKDMKSLVLPREEAKVRDRWKISVKGQMDTKEF